MSGIGFRVSIDLFVTHMPFPVGSTTPIISVLDNMPRWLTNG